MTTAPTPSHPSEIVSGFLAVLSMVASALAVFYQPVKIAPFAILLALIATAMAPRGSRLPLIAVALGGLAFFLGMTIAVATNHSLY